MERGNRFTQRSYISGLSFIETIVGVALFALVSIMLYTTYSRVFVTARSAQARIDAIALANEQFEFARNLPYSEVGTVSGVPSGVILPVQTLTRGGMTFIATTTIRNIDQPFDGTAGGSPNDLSPADNKLIEVDITCTTCVNFRPMLLTTWIGPLNLEGSSTNGSLFVRAIDASGLPVSKADVHIFNGSTTPLIDIHDITSTSGLLQLVDVPPGTNNYQVQVSKSGYSSEQTYGAPTTTNPVKPHATVAAQTVTQLTFSIDRTATMNFSSVSPSCGAIPNIHTHIVGSKLVGTLPDVPKYESWTNTDSSGLLTLNNMEWDTYAISATSAPYELAGVVPLLPVSISPGSTQNIQLIMVPKSDPSVLVTVKDAGTGLPIAGATVSLEKGGASTTQTTGRGFLRQTDWSGGSGQEAFVDPTAYWANDGNIDAIGVLGEVHLLDLLGTYPASGWLESSTFDTGSPSNFYQFTYQPTTQPTETGESSLQFQIATGNSTSSWTYLGPDGTNATYYNATTTDISAVNNGNRYLRYKMYLSTASSTLSPSASDVQFTFTSSCVPPGQVIFQGLANGTYNVSVTATGYADYTGTVDVLPGTPWQEVVASLTP